MRWETDHSDTSECCSLGERLMWWHVQEGSFSADRKQTWWPLCSSHHWLILSEFNNPRIAEINYILYLDVWNVHKPFLNMRGRDEIMYKYNQCWFKSEMSVPFYWPGWYDGFESFLVNAGIRKLCTFAF